MTEANAAETAQLLWDFATLRTFQPSSNSALSKYTKLFNKAIRYFHQLESQHESNI